jgi:thiol-disulfide isomerase/thioredoxin
MKLLTVCAALALLTGCAGDPPEAPTQPAATAAKALPTGIWRAVATREGTEVPFTMEVAQSAAGYAVTYLNGPERMPVEQVQYDPATGRLELNFPSYSAGLVAQVDGDRMTGAISLARKNRTIELGFTADHGQDYRFFPSPAAEYEDFGGRWQVEITVPEYNFTQPAVAIFEQTDGVISGTVNTQVGDYRFLHGEVRGEQLFLSTFDGSGTQLWTAEQQPDGSLRGSFDSVTYGTAEWTAVRNADFKLEDPTKLTVMKEGYDTLEFSLPDLDGNIVSLSDERFADKVVIVVLGGSWCPSCHDEAAFMVPFQAAYAGQDLEVIYIMFEYSDDFSEAEPQLRAFRERYGITHPILFAGDSARTSRADKLPMLNDIMAFPTTIFMDRSGTVRRIHTAFPGPATGQEHADYKREFRSFVDMLLAENG